MCKTLDVTSSQNRDFFGILLYTTEKTVDKTIFGVNLDAENFVIQYF